FRVPRPTPSGFTRLPPIKAMVLLIGNYPLDRYPSMQLFNDLMLSGLAKAGVPTKLVRPEPVFGNIFSSGVVGKWLGYIDKFVLFPFRLGKELAARPSLVHVCDHSGAMYVPKCKRRAPVVVTCHDLLAVRGALGQQTDCPPSLTGHALQRWILRGLQKADVV